MGLFDWWDKRKEQNEFESEYRARFDFTLQRIHFAINFAEEVEKDFNSFRIVHSDLEYACKISLRLAQEVYTQFVAFHKKRIEDGMSDQYLRVASDFDMLERNIRRIGEKCP